MTIGDPNAITSKSEATLHRLVRFAQVTAVIQIGICLAALLPFLLLNILTYDDWLAMRCDLVGLAVFAALSAALLTLFLATYVGRRAYPDHPPALASLLLRVRLLPIGKNHPD